jgi:hypothetical protein
MFNAVFEEWAPTFSAFGSGSFEFEFVAAALIMALKQWGFGLTPWLLRGFVII